MPWYSEHRFAWHQICNRFVATEQWNYRKIWNCAVFQPVEKQKNLFADYSFNSFKEKSNSKEKTGIGLRSIRLPNMAFYEIEKCVMQVLISSECNGRKAIHIGPPRAECVICPKILSMNSIRSSHSTKCGIWIAGYLFTLYTVNKIIYLNRIEWNIIRTHSSEYVQSERDTRNPWERDGI